MTELFRWPCGYMFEARITPDGRGLQYRLQCWDKGDWESAGTLSQAQRFAAGENPYGMYRLGTIHERPYGPVGAPSNTARARRCVARVLKHLGVHMLAPEDGRPRARR